MSKKTKPTDAAATATDVTDVTDVLEVTRVEPSEDAKAVKAATGIDVPADFKFVTQAEAEAEARAAAQEKRSAEVRRVVATSVPEVDPEFDWKTAPDWATHVGRLPVAVQVSHQSNIIWYNATNYQYVDHPSFGDCAFAFGSNAWDLSNVQQLAERPPADVADVADEGTDEGAQD